MARGESGRIVLEIDPDLKGELYVQLARRGITLKAWFVGEANRLVLSEQHQSLSIGEPPAPRYGVTKSPIDSEGVE